MKDRGRIQGRRGVELRKRRLANDPLCRECKGKGIIRIADVVDHIQPLALGGLDVDDNCQPLCHPCHDLKTAMESASSQGVSFHPDWLKPSAIPLTIVCGPPCSGKTTYIRERAKPEDTVIDLDTIITRIDPTYKHWTGGLHTELLHKATRVRNEMLGGLSRAKRGRAWFIVGAPTEAERKWWGEKLGGEVVLLHPGVDECKRRAVTRGTPQAIRGVDRWERSSRSPWVRKPSGPRKVAYGADGWPIE